MAIGTAVFTTATAGPAVAAENAIRDLVMADEVGALMQKVYEGVSTPFQTFGCRDRILNNFTGISVEDTNMLQDMVK